MQQAGKHDNQLCNSVPLFTVNCIKLINERQNLQRNLFHEGVLFEIEKRTYEERKEKKRYTWMLVVWTECPEPMEVRGEKKE